jgi:hypothetical protein
LYQCHGGHGWCSEPERKMYSAPAVRMLKTIRVATSSWDASNTNANIAVMAIATKTEIVKQ